MEPLDFNKFAADLKSVDINKVVEGLSDNAKTHLNNLQNAIEKIPAEFHGAVSDIISHCELLAKELYKDDKQS